MISGLTMSGALRLGFGPGSERVVVGSLLTCHPLATAIPSARQISSTISDHIKEPDLTAPRCLCRRFDIVRSPSLLLDFEGPIGQGWLAGWPVQLSRRL